MDDLTERVLLEGAVLAFWGFGAVFSTGVGYSLSLRVKALWMVSNDATMSKGTS